MKNVVMTGASGVVGARALDHLLARHDVGRVVALGRRVLPLKHENLVSRVVDVQNTAAMATEIPDDVTAAICCLGTTMKKAGSKEAFRAIDRDAVTAFGEAARQRGAQRFLLVSSIGAHAHARNFYLKTKGEAEEGLQRLGYPQLTIVRPSFIDDEGRRSEYRLAERLALPAARAVFSILRNTSRYAPVSAEAIGKALVQLAFDETTERVRTINSEQIHLLGR